MGQVPGELPALTHPEPTHRALAICSDDGLDLRAAPSAGELVVLLAQAPAGSKQHALDHRLRDSHALADLVVRETLELSQHDHPVVALGQPAERAPEIVEPLLAFDGYLGRRRE
jgi:hypothetical protein